MDFKFVDKKYRPIPFWSWNERLDTEETARQVKVMDKAGMGGFFMHARGGLLTDYMSEEWFDNVEAAVETAEKCGMRPWAYDENGWPSGFCDGIVSGMGVEYQQKKLCMEKEPNHTDTAICRSGEHYFYYEVNPFYVDTLDKKVIKKFIEVAYEPYYERFKNRIEGYFTDEPQILRDGIPWSFVFEEEYSARYNEKIKDHLEELFLPVGDYKSTRIKYWKMVTDLFSSAYMQQIYDWCDKRGLKLTGHLLFEETPGIQLTRNGACMPHYEYMHIPGVDWLCRTIYDCLTAKQASSVAEQLGKEGVISETFALCGHNISFSELKGIAEWQMVRGVDLLCQHLEGYSIRGIRKRDYPPAMYFQQPWWSEYDKFIDALSRECMLLNKGAKNVNVLVIHPQTTAWSLFDNGSNKGLEELNDEFLEVIKKLEKRHIEYHLGDETIMERHARVENGRIIIGTQSYDTVIISCCKELFNSTRALLEEYKNQGGRVAVADELSANNIIENEDITYTSRDFDDFILHYFVNTSEKEIKAKINCIGKRIDIFSGEIYEFCGVHEFEAWGSLMLIENKTHCEKNIQSENIDKETYIYPEGNFEIKGKVKNAVTLDRCDYYFDGKLQEKNGYVLNIAERANALGHGINLHQDYYINVREIPDELYLVCETPEKFKIKINSREIEYKDSGFFRDRSFRKIDISRYIIEGKNKISFDCYFVQSEKFYENLKKAAVFESEKNKLAYDMEIESIYLIGEFCVRTDGEWIKLDKKAYRYKGDFVLERPCKSISLNNIQKQGFPFWCGELTVEGEINISGENPVLKLNPLGINAVKVKIGEVEKTVLTDKKLDLNVFGLKGKQRMKLTLINNLRNLLGPHHLKEGECYAAGPFSFFKEKCIWNDIPEPYWDDDYCFVETGLI